MDCSPLNNLPLELRDRIYEVVAINDQHISISVRTGKPVTNGVDLRFMRVCRQMREEATPIFYSTNSFTIVTKFLEAEGEPGKPENRRPFSGIQAWLGFIGPENAKSLSRVCIDLGWYTVEGEHSRITDFMGVAKEEIQLLKLPPSVMVLRAAYFIEVFPPIGHIMRYIDIPLNDRETAKHMLETTTNRSKENMPPYAFNRETVNHTMDLFKNGILGIVL